jgi:hypothetical protein
VELLWAGRSNETRSVEETIVYLMAMSGEAARGFASIQGLVDDHVTTVRVPLAREGESYIPVLCEANSRSIVASLVEILLEGPLEMASREYRNGFLHPKHGDGDAADDAPAT